MCLLSFSFTKLGTGKFYLQTTFWRHPPSSPVFAAARGLRQPRRYLSQTGPGPSHPACRE